MPSHLPIATEATAQPKKTPKLRLVDPRAVFDVVFVCGLLLFILHAVWFLGQCPGFLMQSGWGGCDMGDGQTVCIILQ